VSRASQWITTATETWAAGLVKNAAPCFNKTLVQETYSPPLQKFFYHPQVGFFLPPPRGNSTGVCVFPTTIVFKGLGHVPYLLFFLHPDRHVAR
jgi:hypothetical protein